MILYGFFGSFEVISGQMACPIMVVLNHISTTCILAFVTLAAALDLPTSHLSYCMVCSTVY